MSKLLSPIPEFLTQCGACLDTAQRGVLRALTSSAGYLAFETAAAFPLTGAADTIYRAADTGRLYHWNPQQEDYEQVGAGGDALPTSSALHVVCSGEWIPLPCRFLLPDTGTTGTPNPDSVLTHDGSWQYWAKSCTLWPDWVGRMTNAENNCNNGKVIVNVNGGWVAAYAVKEACALRAQAGCCWNTILHPVVDEVCGLYFHNETTGCCTTYLPWRSVAPPGSGLCFRTNTDYSGNLESLSAWESSASGVSWSEAERLPGELDIVSFCGLSASICGVSGSLTAGSVHLRGAIGNYSTNVTADIVIPWSQVLGVPAICSYQGQDQVSLNGTCIRVMNMDNVGGGTPVHLHSLEFVRLANHLLFEPGTNGCVVVCGCGDRLFSVGNCGLLRLGGDMASLNIGRGVVRMGGRIDVDSTPWLYVHYWDMTLDPGGYMGVWGTSAVSFHDSNVYGYLEAPDSGLCLAGTDFTSLCSVCVSSVTLASSFMRGSYLEGHVFASMLRAEADSVFTGVVIDPRNWYADTAKPEVNFFDCSHYRLPGADSDCAFLVCAQPVLTAVAWQGMCMHFYDQSQMTGVCQTGWELCASPPVSGLGPLYWLGFHQDARYEAKLYVQCETSNLLSMEFHDRSVLAGTVLWPPYAALSCISMHCEACLDGHVCGMLICMRDSSMIGALARIEKSTIRKHSSVCIYPGAELVDVLLEELI